MRGRGRVPHAYYRIWAGCEAKNGSARARIGQLYPCSSTTKKCNARGGWCRATKGDDDDARFETWGTILLTTHAQIQRRFKLNLQNYNILYKYMLLSCAAGGYLGSKTDENRQSPKSIWPLETPRHLTKKESALSVVLRGVVSK